MHSIAVLMSLVEKGERAHDLDLRGADLKFADLSRASADRLALVAANLRCSKFCGARLGSCHFQNAHLEESDWFNATVRMSVMDGAIAMGARFDGARVEDCSAKGADLTRASLRGTRLTETSFERAVLCEARLDDAQGDGVVFRGADLSGAHLSGAKLDEADFRGADLHRADFSNGRFRDADFRGAILDDAVFAGADLEGAQFDEGHDSGSDTVSEAADDAQRSDNALLISLQNALSGLPGALESPESPLAEFQSQLQEAIVAIGESADRSPDELASRIESVAKMARSGEASDVKEMLDGACDGSEELQKLRATTAELFEKLQHFAGSPDGASDRPPEEWRSWLEPLVNMTESGRPPDLNALLEAVSSVTQGVPLTHRDRHATHKSQTAGVNRGKHRR